MKHIVDIDKERSDCNVRPVLYPYMASASTMRFCRKFSSNNMARVGLKSIKNRLCQSREFRANLQQIIMDSRVEIEDRNCHRAEESTQQVVLMAALCLVLMFL